MNLEIFVPGIPAAQARPRTHFWRGRVITMSPKTPWYYTVCRKAKATRPAIPLNGGLELTVVFYFPEKKSARNNLSEKWKKTKPDLDNLLKAIKDALTQALWWEDDGRVVRAIVEKRYATSPGEMPGAYICVKEIQLGDREVVYGN